MSAREPIWEPGDNLVVTGRALTLALRLLCTAAVGLASVTGCNPCAWHWESEPFELGIDTDLHAVTSYEWDHYLAVGAEGTVVAWGYEYPGNSAEPFVEIAKLGDADLRGVWISDWVWIADTEVWVTSWWVVGDGGTVAVSDNHGVTWKTLTLAGDSDALTIPGGGPNLHAITGFAGRPVIVGDEIVLVQLDDGTWIEPPTPPGGWGQLRGVSSPDDRRIYAVGLGGALWSTSDPSDEWTAVAHDIDEDLLDVGSFAGFDGPADTVAIVGSQGTVLLADPRGWTRLDTGVSVDLIDYDQDTALAADGGLYRIDQDGPLTLVDTFASASALIHDFSGSLITVGAGGSATAPPGLLCP